MNVRIKIVVYDKSTTFLFECDETCYMILRKFCDEVNYRMRDAYYFDSIQVERV